MLALGAREARYRLASETVRPSARPPRYVPCNFGVPDVRAVLTRSTLGWMPTAIALMLDHGGARVLITDRESQSQRSNARSPSRRLTLPVDVYDGEYSGPGKRIGVDRLRAFLADALRIRMQPPGRMDAIATHYPSARPAIPKGVVSHHLGAVAQRDLQHRNLVDAAPRRVPVDVSDVPLHGWCFPGAWPANAGTNVCLRRVAARLILDPHPRAQGDGTTCGAPIVHSPLINADPKLREGIATGAAMVAAARRRGDDRGHGEDGLGPDASSDG